MIARCTEKKTHLLSVDKERGIVAFFGRIPYQYRVGALFGSLWMCHAIAEHKVHGRDSGSDVGQLCASPGDSASHAATQT